MQRYLKISILSLLLLVLIIALIAIDIAVLFYIYLWTEDFPLYIKLPVLASAGVFLFLMGYGGLKKSFSKTKLSKRRKILKSKLP